MYETFEDYFKNSKFYQDSDLKRQDQEFFVFEQQRNSDIAEIKESTLIQDSQNLNTRQRQMEISLQELTKKKRIVNSQGNQYVKQDFIVTNNQNIPSSGNFQNNKQRIKLEQPKQELNNKRAREQLDLQDSEKVKELKKELYQLMNNSSFTLEQKKKGSLKIKNKIFAQQSRDRKQAYVEQLEQTNYKLQLMIKNLQNELVALKSENVLLKQSMNEKSSCEVKNEEKKKQSSDGLSKASLIVFTFVSVLSFIWILGMITLDSTGSNLNQSKYSQQELESRQDTINYLYKSQLNQQVFEQELVEATKEQFLGQKNLQLQDSIHEKQNQSNFNMAFFCQQPIVFHGGSKKQEQLDFAYFYIPEKFFESLIESFSGFIFRIQNVQSVHEMKDVSFVPIFKDEH